MMVWLGFQIGAGFFLFGIVLALAAWGGSLLIDCVDAWSSRVTAAEATRRARLVNRGRWPSPAARPWSTMLEWGWLMVGLLAIVLTKYLARSTQ